MNTTPTKVVGTVVPRRRPLITTTATCFPFMEGRIYWHGGVAYLPCIYQNTRLLLLNDHPFTTAMVCSRLSFFPG